MGTPGVRWKPLNALINARDASRWRCGVHQISHSRIIMQEKSFILKEKFGNQLLVVFCKGSRSTTTVTFWLMDKGIHHCSRPSTKRYSEDAVSNRFLVHPGCKTELYEMFRSKHWRGSVLSRHSHIHQADRILVSKVLKCHVRRSLKFLQAAATTTICLVHLFENGVDSVIQGPPTRKQPRRRKPKKTVAYGAHRPCRPQKKQHLVVITAKTPVCRWWQQTDDHAPNGSRTSTPWLKECRSSPKGGLAKSSTITRRQYRYENHMWQSDLNRPAETWFKERGSQVNWYGCRSIPVVLTIGMMAVCRCLTSERDDRYPAHAMCTRSTRNSAWNKPRHWLRELKNIGIIGRQKYQCRAWHGRIGMEVLALWCIHDVTRRTGCILNKEQSRCKLQHWGNFKEECWFIHFISSASGYRGIRNIISMKTVWWRMMSSLGQRKNAAGRWSFNALHNYPNGSQTRPRALKMEKICIRLFPSGDDRVTSEPPIQDDHMDNLYTDGLHIVHARWCIRRWKWQRISDQIHSWCGLTASLAGF